MERLGDAGAVTPGWRGAACGGEGGAAALAAGTAERTMVRLACPGSVLAPLPVEATGPAAAALVPLPMATCSEQSAAAQPEARPGAGSAVAKRRLPAGDACAGPAGCGTTCGIGGVAPAMPPKVAAQSAGAGRRRQQQRHDQAGAGRSGRLCRKPGSAIFTASCGLQGSWCRAIRRTAAAIVAAVMSIANSLIFTMVTRLPRNENRVRSGWPRPID